MSKISPWMPEQDRIRLAMLGKLIEELGEATQRAARCITHGIDETDPDTGRTNREELEREIADVRACETVLDDLDVKFDRDRWLAKVNGFRKWHGLIHERTHSNPTWECKDYADGWIPYATLEDALAYQKETGCAMRPVYK